MVPNRLKLKNTIKYPTTLIVGGVNSLGFEIADSLIKQGGYVVIVDTVNEANVAKFDYFGNNDLISFLDFTAIPHLEEDIRRLDYVFYFNHESLDFRSKVSTQEFLTFSNYLDATLTVTAKFEARFLITTSIKAQQVLMTEKEYGLEFYKPDKHTQTYTDMEVQRYAEGLTLEYFEKINLNAKVLRLGEIIGDGINFETSSNLSDILLDAAKRKKVRLKNDGLENEWFVHLLDCAYALIKAQFSKGTEGKVCSVTYDTPYTHLSIAYKLQEIDEEISDIEFIEDEDDLPPIKIQKPAPNLSEIGWMPRINFDKAMRQSLAAAKLYLVEKGVSGMTSKSTQPKREAGFFGAIFGNNYEDDDVEKRKQRLLEANKRINQKKLKRERTLGQKIQNMFWVLFIKIANVFTIFKRRSPLELGFLAFSIILIGIIYFYAISPALVIARNGFSAYPAYENVKSNSENLSKSELFNEVEEIEKSLSNINSTLDKFEDEADFLTLGDEYRSLKKTVELYNSAASGARDIAYFASSYGEYLEKFENNTQLRNNENSFISTQDEGLNLSEDLVELKRRASFYDSGIEKLREASFELENLNLSIYTSTIQNEIREINTFIDQFIVKSQSFESYKFLPEVLGVDTPKTYGVLILDNSKFSPIGGEISSIGLFTINNGSLQEVIVTDPNEIALSDAVKSDYTEEVNLRRFAIINETNLEFNDLTTIQEYPTFAESIRDSLENNYNRDVEGVLTLNLNALNNIFNELEVGENLEITNVALNPADLLTSINSIQPANASISERKEIISESFAKILFEALNNVENNSARSQLENSLNSQNIRAHFFDLDINEFIAEKNYNSSQTTDLNAYVDVGFLNLDNRVTEVDRLSTASLALEVFVDSEYNLINSLSVDLQTPLSSNEASICLPANTDISSILVENVDQNRVITNTNSDAICVTVQLLNQKKFKIDWRIDALSDPSENYELRYGIAKVNGLDTNLDMTFRVNNTIQINSVNKDISVAGSSFAFAELMNGDEILEVKLER